MIKAWHYSQKNPIRSDYISINGYAIDEPMPPCICDRPKGTGDWLFMVFRSPVNLLVNKKPQRVNPDTIIIWPPGDYQYYGNPDGKFSHSWIHCNGQMVAQAVRTCRIPCNQPVYNFDTAGFENQLAGIHYEFDHFQSPDARVIENHLQNLFYLIQRYTQTAQPVVQIPLEVREARDYMETHFKEAVKLKQVARIAKTSVSHFSSKFKQAYGVSPIDYLIRFRMSEVRRGLRDKNKRIGEVAFANGFDDVYYFSKMVRKHFGKSPRELRSEE